MKCFLGFTLFLFSIFQIYSQNISGRVINSQTNEPIPHMLIQVNNSEKYQISNEDGSFSFDFKEIENKSIIFEDTFYHKKEIKITNSDFLIVKLDAKGTTLEEIIIVNKPYAKIFEDIFTAPSNAIDKQVKLETYYIESVYDNKNLIKTADGLVDFYIIDKKKNFVNSKILESRIRNISDKKDEELQTISLEASPSKIVEVAIQMSEIKKIGKDKKYDYHTTAYYVGNKQMHSLYFYPKENTTDDLMFSGKIIYDADTKKIEEISYDLLKDHSKYTSKYKNLLIAKFKFNELKISSKFSVLNGFNIVTYANYHINMDVKAFGKVYFYNNNIKMLTHKMDVLETKKYEKDYFSNQSLFKFGNNNHSKFWEKEPFKNWELKF